MRTFLVVLWTYCKADLYVRTATYLFTNNASEPNWYPDPRVTNNPNAPVTLLFLANRVQYMDQAVEDPWFLATDTATGYADGAGYTEYYSGPPGSVLGCFEEVQIW